MGIIELFLLGIGLSMDAVAVTITNTLCYPNLTNKEKLSMPLAFGFFQGGMPLIGFFAGNMFASYINKYAGIITLIVLGFIGSQMIIESIKEKKRVKENNGCDCCEAGANFNFRTLLLQAIATSIDAFAVGVSLAAQNTNIFFATIIIGLTTMLCCIIALWIGKKFGSILGIRAQIVGGIILILIGLRAIL